MDNNNGENKEIYNVDEVADLEVKALKSSMNMIEYPLHIASRMLSIIIQKVFLNSGLPNGVYYDTDAENGRKNTKNYYEDKNIILEDYQNSKTVLFKERGYKALKDAFNQSTDHSQIVLNNPKRFRPANKLFD